ncbi:hypothetical protein BC343_08720 [Mucilaginibacter pedocola]|uniref:L,D-TPase catalytic domain-containing protein n=2 Tax=Mucilaginibacter pedocola TaxID=1792845 RepID=A0A1S9PE94_9SPHI|nr:hypothetical protein BC343_08720 [Mucilaginibacter pedocola]
MTYQPSKLDNALSAEISKQISQSKLPLNFPLSVRRFYAQRQYNANWVANPADADKTWSAMLMIDCVLQFGLNHADYHPTELLYSKLHDILERPNQVPLAEQARFDIMLTDAMLSFTNNLHYGKYNPLFAGAKIDKGNLAFNAIDVINNAMQSKDLMRAVLNVQPRSKAYQNMQARLHVIAGVQTGDCYEFPEAEVRKIALNMERLRWAALDTDNFIHVNIPSAMLSFYHNGAVDSFRVIIGKPGTPTPTLNSAITHFTSSPEWRVPQSIFTKELLPKAIRDTGYLRSNRYNIYNNAGMLITPDRDYLKAILKTPKRYYATQTSGCDNALGQLIFKFPNLYEIYIHDTPDQSLFFKNNRVFSHGCLRVQHAAVLAGLLLKNDKAENAITVMERDIAKGIKKDFRLKTPVPIAVTYITCEVVGGAVINYPDPYGLDKNLDMLMYKKDDPTLNIGQN